MVLHLSGARSLNTATENSVISCTPVSTIKAGLCIPWIFRHRLSGCSKMWKLCCRRPCRIGDLLMLLYICVIYADYELVKSLVNNITQRSQVYVAPVCRSQWLVEMECGNPACFEQEFCPLNREYGTKQ